LLEAVALYEIEVELWSEIIEDGLNSLLMTTIDQEQRENFFKASLNCAILATTDKTEVISLTFIEKLLTSAADLCPDFTSSSEHFKKLCLRVDHHPRN